MTKNLRMPMENPKFKEADKHAPKGDGTNAHGDSMHGTFKQPWVSSDGLTDPHGDRKDG